MTGTAFNRHLPQDQFAVLKAAELSERELLGSLVERMGGAS